jgi:hypothetical protein
VTGEIFFDLHEGTNTAVDVVGVNLPGVAPFPLTDETVNFAPGSGSLDFDAACNGTVAVPTAPAGKVCIYIFKSGGINLGQVTGLKTFSQTSRAFMVTLVPSGIDDADEYLYAVWAYTAP